MLPKRTIEHARSCGRIKKNDRIGAERGWPPAFDYEADHGSLYVGAPETVARRIATTANALGISRFHMKYSAGMLSHEKIMPCIELYGRKVIPLTRHARVVASANYSRPPATQV
jgi:hypothetical protein